MTSPAATLASGKQLKDFVRDVTILKRNVEQALEQAELRAQGLEVHIALDFSEIYAYVAHDTSGNNLSLSSLGEFPSAQEQSVLRQLLFGYPSLPILLTSYAIELEGHMRNTQRHAQTQTIDVAARALDQLRKLARAPEFAQTADLARRSLEGHQQLTEEDRILLLNFLERAAPDLLRLAAPSGGSLDNLVALLKSRRFANLEDVTGTIVEPEQEVFDECYWALARQGHRSRRPEETKLDAFAVAMLIKANQLMEKDRRRVVLVTRSPDMHNALKRPSDLKCLEGFHGDLLRHPRAFVLDGHNSDGGNGTSAARLRQQLESIELFLAGAKEAAEEGSGPLSETYRNKMQTLALQISDLWREMLNLGAFMGGASQISEASASLNNLGQLDPIIQLLANPDVGLHLIKDRIKSVSQQLEGLHAFAGFLTQTGEAKNQALVDENVELEDLGRKIVLKAGLDTLPYTVQFRSEKMLQLLRRHGTGNVKYLALVELLIDGFSQGFDYECHLAMAYVLAAIGRWALAESYCERAVVEAADVPGVQPHEAHFLQALCMRKCNRSPARHFEALRNLDRALMEKKQELEARGQLHSDVYEDPRYLTERATHLLLLHDTYRDSLTRPDSMRETAHELLAQATHRCENDHRLRCQILNNLMFDAIRDGVVRDLARTRQMHDELVAAQTSHVGPNRRYWAPQILDTVVMAHWYAIGCKDEDERKELLHQLEWALQKRLTAEEVGRLRKHKKLIEQTPLPYRV